MSNGVFIYLPCSPQQGQDIFLNQFHTPRNDIYISHNQKQRNLNKTKQKSKCTFPGKSKLLYSVKSKYQAGAGALKSLFSDCFENYLSKLILTKQYSLCRKAFLDFIRRLSKYESISTNIRQPNKQVKRIDSLGGNPLWNCIYAEISFNEYLIN